MKWSNRSGRLRPARLAVTTHLTEHAAVVALGEEEPRTNFRTSTAPSVSVWISMQPNRAGTRRHSPRIPLSTRHIRARAPRRQRRVIVGMSTPAACAASRIVDALGRHRLSLLIVGAPRSQNCFPPVLSLQFNPVTGPQIHRGSTAARSGSAPDTPATVQTTKMIQRHQGGDLLKPARDRRGRPCGGGSECFEHLGVPAAWRAPARFRAEESDQRKLDRRYRCPRHQISKPRCPGPRPSHASRRSPSASTAPWG